MNKLTQENIDELLKEAQKTFDGGFIWQYMETTTNIKELLAAPGNDTAVSVAMAGFFAGMRFALENIDFEDEEPGKEGKTL